MIHFNELYITEDNKKLIIDVEVDDDPMFEDCYLDSIQIAAGSNCPSPFSKSVTAWTAVEAFDINGDGKLTEEDIEVINHLLHISTAPAITNEDEKTDFPIIGNDGEYYYKIQDDQADEQHYIKNYISKYIYDLCISIYNKYILNTDNLFVFGVCQFITESYDAQIYDYIRKKLDIVPSVLGVSGDINGDGEVNVGDINALIDFLLSVIDDDVPIKLKRKRLCLSFNDEVMVALTGEAKKPLNGLFAVEITTTCDIETLVNTDCGCIENNVRGIAYNPKPLYDNAVRYAQSYGDTCATNDQSQFIDWILRYYAFKFAVDNGDICQA